MVQEVSRRAFITRMAIPVVLAPVAINLKAADISPPEVTRPEPRRPGPLSKEQVFAFVQAGHRDKDKVSALLDEQPNLVYASWDWGGGDWETGLGGASHMGRRDIARHLLRRGARKDIFAAAMLGERDVVRAMVSADASMAD